MGTSIVRRCLPGAGYRSDRYAARKITSKKCWVNCDVALGLLGNYPICRIFLTAIERLGWTNRKCTSNEELPVLTPKRFINVLPILLALSIAPLTVTAQDLTHLQARLEIAEQLTQYSYRWDSKDAKGFAELFTDDAVIERWGNGELIRGSRRVGRQAIYEYAKTSHEGRLADRQTRHHMSGLIFIELSENTAITENMGLITHQTADSGAPFISGSGIYRNHWKKTATGWQLMKRMLFSDRVN